MNYATIKDFDIANGTGVRVSLFVSGCTHRCPDCFNEVAWDFHYGNEFTQDTIDYIVKALAPSHIKGLSLLGGEPMEKSNQDGLLPLLQKVHEVYPDKTIWCYTGYLLEDLLMDGKVHTSITDKVLSYIDVLVDGPYLKAERNIRLKFRGSNNQRLIDVKKSLKLKSVVLWEEK